MLYDLWRQCARDRGNERALLDLATGRAWTFRELLTEAENGANADGPVAFPQGGGADFVFTVLRAWRAGHVVCPLEASQARPAFARFPAGCIHLKSTSASTGAVRWIAMTADQLAADARNIVSTMGLRSGWPNLGVISLAHSYGFSNLVTPLLLHGIPLVLAPSQLPEAVRQAVARVGDCTLAAVPALWRAWHEADALPDGIRLAISAGAPLPLSLEHTVFARRGLKLHNFYGASECGGIAYDRSNTPRADATCVGAPMDHVLLSVNETGTLEVRGANVGLSYWPTADDALGGGCFRTSDLAELLDGAVFLRGRAGDLINVAGRKVSPESIERALAAHPGVRDCLVFGVPDGTAARNELIVAVVVPAEGVGAEELKQFLLRALPAWQVPREWRFEPALAPNARGKLSRAEWRKKLAPAAPAQAWK